MIIYKKLLEYGGGSSQAVVFGLGIPNDYGERRVGVLAPRSSEEIVDVPFSEGGGVANRRGQ